MRKLYLFAAISLLVIANTFGQSFKQIQKIEPTFWWVGMEKQEVQLLIYGNGIGNFQPTINYQGVDLLNVIKVENPNYLFLTLRITPNAKAGQMPITLTNGKTKFIQNYELKSRRANARQKPELTSADVVYLIMPDRFANGNTANDNVEGYHDKLDRQNPNGRHGGDLEGIIKHLDYLKELGITAIWLTPALDNNIKGVSYHGYSITDHYKIDARFGTNEDYVRMVEEAHKRGIKVILDVVFNQMGNDHFTNLDRPCHDWVNEWPTYTSSSFRGNCMPDPHASKSDIDHMIKGWFTPIMPDFNQQNPLVENYLKQYVTWWVEYSNLDVLRFDTYQFNDKAVSARWAAEIRAEYPNITTFVEVWNDSPAVVSSWQQNGSDKSYQSNIPSMIDFPFMNGLTGAMSKNGSIESIYYTVAQDFLYSNADANVIFFANHDLNRIYTSLNEDLAKLKMTTAILMTIRGIPQLYYADEILYTGVQDSTGDGPRRKDFMGGWENDATNSFTSSGRSGDAADYFNYLKHLLNWRKANSDLMAGKLIHFHPYNELYMYFRVTDTRTLMVVVNNNKETQSINYSRFNEVIKNRDKGIDIITNQDVILDSNYKVAPQSVQIIELK